MRYNEDIAYNSSSISYTGSVVIYVPGTATPVIVDELTIIIGSSIDHSNATYTGVISIDYNPTGIVTIQALQDQAEAISQSSIIYVELQAETSPDLNRVQGITSSTSVINQNNISAEIEVLNTSQLGSLFIS